MTQSMLEKTRKLSGLHRDGLARDARASRKTRRRAAKDPPRASFDERLAAARPAEILGSVVAQDAGAPHAPRDVTLAVQRSFAMARADWEAFQDRHACTAFQRHDWLSAWHETLGKAVGIELLLVFVHDRDAVLRMILPLGIEQGVFGRALVWLGAPVCDYNAPLVDADFARRLTPHALERLWRQVLAQAGDIDYVHLTRQPEVIGALANPFSALCREWEPFSAHTMAMSGAWEDFYAARRAAKTRRRQREKDRRLRRMGAVEFVWPENAEERRNLALEILKLKREQLIASGSTNPFAPRELDEFFANVAAAPAAAGVVRLAALKLDGDVIAAVFGLEHKGCFYYVVPVYRSGEFSRCSPGNILLHHLLERGFAAGLTSFDFTIGDESYKKEWSDRSQRLGVLLSPRTARGAIAVFLIRHARALKGFIKARPRLYHLARRALRLKRSLIA